MIAIDLGSNTIRFIEYDGSIWGKSFEKIVRTAESLHSTQKISSKALERILCAIEEAGTYFDFSSHEISAVTTAAVRMAKNGDEIIDIIEKQSGIRFHVIDGDKEASLTMQAVKHRLEKMQIPSHRFILADIGGGSTEIIICDDSQSTSVSLPIGIVTMTEKSSDRAVLDAHLHQFETDITQFLASFSTSIPSMVVMTAGTPTTIAAFRHGMNYHNYDPAKINGTRLTLHDCNQAYTELMAMEEEERAFYVGVGRELLIATGILMVVSLFKGLNADEAVIVDDGLREGVALDYFKNR